MAGKSRRFLDRDGRYFARIVIPVERRAYLDPKTELRVSLDGDRCASARTHPAAVVGLMHQIADAERRRSIGQGHRVSPGRYPMKDAQTARRCYDYRLALNEKARDTAHGYSLLGLDDGVVADLKRGLRGQATDEVLDHLFGPEIGHDQRIGNTTATYGTLAWRSLARVLCQASLEVLEREFKRDAVDVTGSPRAPLLMDVPAAAAPDKVPVSIMGLFSDDVSSRKKRGGGKAICTRWLPALRNLISHPKHNSARKVSRHDLLAWR